MSEVSIIMPAYNAEKYILSSIQSVIDQTFQDWELIIVDDGSTDNTANIVKTMQDIDERIIYVYQQNKRLGAARNSGLRLAKGKWIAFLDSDDLWYPAKLSVQMDFVEKNKVDVVFTDGYMLMEESQEKLQYPIKLGWFTGSEMYNILYTKNIVPILSVLMNSSLINKVGYQDETLSIFGCEDLDYCLRIARNGGSFYGIPQKLFYYRVHSQAMSRNKIVMKLAISTALYNNKTSDLNVDRKYLRDKFEWLCIPVIPELIKWGRKEDAIKQAEILLAFNNKKIYKLLFLYLRSKSTPSLKIVYFLLEPLRSLLRPVKRLVKRHIAQQISF